MQDVRPNIQNITKNVSFHRESAFCSWNIYKKAYIITFYCYSWHIDCRKHRKKKQYEWHLTFVLYLILVMNDIVTRIGSHQMKTVYIKKVLRKAVKTQSRCICQTDGLWSLIIYNAVINQQLIILLCIFKKSRDSSMFWKNFLLVFSMC